MHTKGTKVTTPTDSLYGRSSILLLHPESPTRIRSPSTRVCRSLSSSCRQKSSINFSRSLAHTFDLCSQILILNSNLIQIPSKIDSVSYSFIDLFVQLTLELC